MNPFEEPVKLRERIETIGIYIERAQKIIIEGSEEQAEEARTLVGWLSTFEQACDIIATELETPIGERIRESRIGLPERLGIEVGRVVSMVEQTEMRVDHTLEKLGVDEKEREPFYEQPERIIYEMVDSLEQDFFTSGGNYG